MKIKIPFKTCLYIIFFIVFTSCKKELNDNVLLNSSNIEILFKAEFKNKKNNYIIIGYHKNDSLSENVGLKLLKNNTQIFEKEYKNCFYVFLSNLKDDKLFFEIRYGADMKKYSKFDSLKISDIENIYK